MIQAWYQPKGCGKPCPCIDVDAGEEVSIPCGGLLRGLHWQFCEGCLNKAREKNRSYFARNVLARSISNA